MKITVTENSTRLLDLMTPTQRTAFEFSKEDVGSIIQGTSFLIKNNGTIPFEVSTADRPGDAYGDGFPVLPGEVLELRRIRVPDIWMITDTGQTVELRILIP